MLSINAADLHTMQSTTKKKAKSKASKQNQKKIAQYSTKIETAWKKTLKDIFTVGDLLQKARNELGKDYWVLVNSLSFKERTAERLRRVAENKRLRNPEIQHLLPASWGTLYELTQLSEKEFTQMVDEKKLKPSLTRSEVNEIKDTYRSQDLPAPVPCTKPERKERIITKDYKPALIIEVPDELDDTRALLDLQFIYTLCNDLFPNSPGKSKLRVSLCNAGKLSKEDEKRFATYSRIFAIARKVENWERNRSGKPSMTDPEIVHSLLGAPTDYPEKENAFLLEKIVLAYARRHGLDCITEDALRSVTDNINERGSKFTELVAQLDSAVCALISGKSSNGATTQILETSTEIEGHTNLQGLGLNTNRQ